jgi:hypothetical protein
MPDGNFTGTYTHPTLSATVDGETFSGTVSSITSSSMIISGLPDQSGMNGPWTKQSSTPEPGASADGTWTRSSLTLTISGSTWTLTGMPNGDFTGTYTHPTLIFEGQTFSGTVSSITSSSMIISGLPNESGMNGTWTKQSSTPEPGASLEGTWIKGSVTLTVSGNRWTLSGSKNGTYTMTYNHPTLIRVDGSSGRVDSISSSSMTISGFSVGGGSTLNGTWTKQ